MKIIMRQDFVIIYFENNKIGNAHRRCLFNKNERFLLKNSIRSRKELIEIATSPPLGAPPNGSNNLTPINNLFPFNQILRPLGFSL